MLIVVLSFVAGEDGVLRELRVLLHSPVGFLQGQSQPRT